MWNSVFTAVYRLRREQRKAPKKKSAILADFFAMNEELSEAPFFQGYLI
jgi:hypothetical protein